VKWWSMVLESATQPALFSAMRAMPAVAGAQQLCCSSRIPAKFAVRYHYVFGEYRALVAPLESDGQLCGRSIQWRSGSTRSRKLAQCILLQTPLRFPGFVQRNEAIGHRSSAIILHAFWSISHPRTPFGSCFLRRAFAC